MMNRRVRHPLPTAAILVILLLVFGCHLVNCGKPVISNASRRNLRGNFGMEHYQKVTKEESEVLVTSSVEQDMCVGRVPRNESSSSSLVVVPTSTSWTTATVIHDDDWYRTCHENLKRADTLTPNNQWTHTEFAKFVQFQSHTENFKRQLPLPLKMIFNELSCRCVLNEGSTDCCHGANAKIAPAETDNLEVWMDSICDRVDNAIDEVCRRRQQGNRSRGAGEL